MKKIKYKFSLYHKTGNWIHFEELIEEDVDPRDFLGMWAVVFRDGTPGYAALSEDKVFNIQDFSVIQMVKVDG